MQNGTSSGLWSPNIQLKHLFYGFDCVTKHLLSTLPTPTSKVLIITGHSLFTKTPLVKELESLLGKKHHAATFSGIRQHGPSADIDAALSTILEKISHDDEIDTIISLGGGSPIDSAKTLSYRVSERRGKWLTHISIPTTLSAAECTPGGGYTKPDGTKTGFMAPEMAVTSIFYDPYFASFTPRELWLTTGIRALDHAVECFYHGYASEIWKFQALAAARELFENLPKAAAQDDDAQTRDFDVTTKLQLAAFLSSGLKGGNLKGGMGLSHALGHAMGSPYGIPHGVTSCFTLGKVVKTKAMASKDDAEQIARLVPAVGTASSGDVVKDACEVGDRIIRLVDELGVSPGTLSDRGISRDEIGVIVGRACGGDADEGTRSEVTRLVESLF